MKDLEVGKICDYLGSKGVIFTRCCKNGESLELYEDGTFIEEHSRRNDDSYGEVFPVALTCNNCGSVHKYIIGFSEYVKFKNGKKD